MCVWDGTYTLSEEEREALDQVPGRNDDAASIPERGCATGVRASHRGQHRRMLRHPKAP
jgi:hypothetical protein